MLTANKLLSFVKRFVPQFLVAVLTYHVEVTTGDRARAGTDANVFLTVHGKAGTSGQRALKLSTNNKNKFEQGQTDIFEVEMADLGELTKCVVTHDGSGPGKSVGDPGELTKCVVTHDRSWPGKSVGDLGELTKCVVTHDGSRPGKSVGDLGELTKCVVTHDGSGPGKSVGDQGELTKCVVTRDGSGPGKSVGDLGELTKCVVTHDGSGPGKSVADRGELTECVVTHNGSEPGKSVADRGELTECAVTHNGSEPGKSVADRGELTECVVTHNVSEPGKSVADRGELTECAVTHDGSGPGKSGTDEGYGRESEVRWRWRDVGLVRSGTIWEGKISKDVDRYKGERMVPNFSGGKCRHEHLAPRDRQNNYFFVHISLVDQERNWLKWLNWVWKITCKPYVTETRFVTVNESRVANMYISP